MTYEEESAWTKPCGDSVRSGQASSPGVEQIKSFQERDEMSFDYTLAIDRVSHLFLHGWFFSVMLFLHLKTRR